MSLSRMLFSSIRRNCSAESFTVLKRLAPCKRFHSSSYMRSGRRTNTSPMLPMETPNSNSWSHLIIPGAALGGIAGLVFLIHHNDERRAIPKGQEVKVERSAIEGPIIGGPFYLIDTEGRVVTERDFVGNWVLFYFGYTSSPDVGPAEVEKMAKAIDILESKQNLKVLPVFVSIDPQRDTPSHLRAYLNEFDKRIIGLTGPVKAIRQIANEYRVYIKKADQEGDDYLIESSHNMYLLNPNMQVTKSFGVEYCAQDLSEAIVKELKKTRM